MTRTLITTTALAALLAASALSNAAAQTRDVRPQQDEEAAGLLLPAVQSAREAVRPEPQANAIDPHYTSLDDLNAPAAAASEFARTLTPNSGGQTAPAADRPVEEVTLGYTRIPVAQPKPESDNKSLQRRGATVRNPDQRDDEADVEAGNQNGAALIVPAVQSAREAARRGCAGGVADGTDTDSDGCAAAEANTAGQGGGGIYNEGGTAPAAAQIGRGRTRGRASVDAASAAAGARDNCDEALRSATEAADRNHDEWITLDSAQATANCDVEGDGEVEIDSLSEITIVRSRVRRGMQDLKN